MIVTTIMIEIMMKYNSSKEIVTENLMTLNTKTTHSKKQSDGLWRGAADQCKSCYDIKQQFNLGLQIR